MYGTICEVAISTDKTWPFLLIQAIPFLLSYEVAVKTDSAVILLTNKLVPVDSSYKWMKPYMVYK